MDKTVSNILKTAATSAVVFSFDDEFPRFTTVFASVSKHPAMLETARKYQMEFHNRKSFLELKLVWKDDDMFELRVTATNGRYSGITEVYDTSDALMRFAKSLYGYPKDDNYLLHEAGQTNGYAYFAMKFYYIDNAGHVGVQVSLEENVSTQYRQEEKDKLQLEIVIEPSAIDDFQKELLQLAIQKEGVATLYGRNM